MTPVMEFSRCLCIPLSLDLGKVYETSQTWRILTRCPYRPVPPVRQ